MRNPSIIYFNFRMFRKIFIHEADRMKNLPSGSGTQVPPQKRKNVPGTQDSLQLNSDSPNNKRKRGNSLGTQISLKGVRRDEVSGITKPGKIVNRRVAMNENEIIPETSDHQEIGPNEKVIRSDTSNTNETGRQRIFSCRVVINKDKIISGTSSHQEIGSSLQSVDIDMDETKKPRKIQKKYVQTEKSKYSLRDRE